MKFKLEGDNMVPKIALGTSVALMLAATGALGATIGNAVTSGGVDIAAAETIGGANAAERTTLVELAGIGAAKSDVVGYFIPLAGSACIFGETCGTQADTGRGGGPMSMFLRFSGVEGGQSILNLWFEDLDLISANDPDGFFESVRIFGDDQNQMAFFDDIADPGVTGDKDTQQVISLDLGTLAGGSDYTARLDFKSSSSFFGKNTPEYLLAAIDVTPAPLPAAGWMLIGALGGLGAMRRLRKS